jgi:outer membrane protein assembly factor BamB
MPRTLTYCDGNVFIQESGETVCLNSTTGNLVWRTALSPKKKAVATGAAKSNNPRRSQKSGKARTRKNRGVRSLGWTYATVVAQDGVVLSCDGSTLMALDSTNGKLLWQCPAQTPFGKTPSVDILVVGGVVWTSPDLNEGRDLLTGKVVSSNQLSEELVTAGHHHRCYRNKATDRYLIQGYRGLEFRDTQGEDHQRHNWIRGICQYGIMPANGMVYIPPHNCGCYPEAKLFGFWTLKSTESSIDVESLAHNTGVVRGPAYDWRQAGASSFPSLSDWPTHRGNGRRSGVTPSAISADNVAWEIELDARLSAPVIVGDILLVAARDRHEILAQDAHTGAACWRFSAAGPIDSPPTVFGDRALFGSADGCVYCLRLSDGTLAWKLRAAPADRSTVAQQHVESVWPVHGSVLILDDIAYFTAGRSTYIDGGLFLYGVDPVTGDVLARKRLTSAPATALKNTTEIQPVKISQNATDYKTQLSPDRSDAFSMNGNISDILVTDGKAVYLRHMKFDKQLNRLPQWTHHLLSTSTLLDPNESHRSHWFYGNGDFSRLPVAYEWLARGSYGGFSSPLGKLLVFDDQRLWGASWGKIALYTTDITDIDQRLTKDFPRDPSKMTHQPLAETLPIHPRAMVKAGKVLYLAGYPAPSAVRHTYGKPITDRGLLLQVDATDGTAIRQMDLPATPVFDAMAAANGKLYISLENGQLMCLD